MIAKEYVSIDVFHAIKKGAPGKTRAPRMLMVLKL
jgi:hypothetical protein